MSRQVIIVQEPGDVVTGETEVVHVVETQSQGPQGPPGVEGPIGPRGGVGPDGPRAQPITFVQAQAETVWNITHGLDFGIPGVQVLDDSDNTILAEVRFPDTFTVQVGPFEVPTTGKVVIR